MTLNLAEPIAAYFAAESSGPEAVVRCFTNNAVVKDEGQTYEGLAAIAVAARSSCQVHLHLRTAPVRADERQDNRDVSPRR